LHEVGQVEPVAFLTALEKNGRAGVLEDGVVERVALLDFLADLDVEVVVGVLGLPEAAAEVEEVTRRAVGEDVLALDLELELGQERSAMRPAGVGKQLLEGGLGCAGSPRLCVDIRETLHFMRICRLPRSISVEPAPRRVIHAFPCQLATWAGSHRASQGRSLCQPRRVITPANGGHRAKQWGSSRQRR
jgi:hypothetical protein